MHPGIAPPFESGDHRAADDLVGEIGEDLLVADAVLQADHLGAGQHVLERRAQRAGVRPLAGDETEIEDFAVGDVGRRGEAVDAFAPDTGERQAVAGNGVGVAAPADGVNLPQRRQLRRHA